MNNSQPIAARRRLVQALVLVYLAAIVVTPLIAAGAAVIFAPAGWMQLAMLAAAPAIYAAIYLGVCIGLARLTMGAIVAGRFPRDLGHHIYGPRRLYGLCWTAVYYFPPLYHMALTVPLLKKAVLRGFGYRGSLDITLYPDTWIRDLPLLEIEDGVYLSNKATIGSNICMLSGNILVDRIQLERGALIGHLTMIAPGVVVRERAEIGVGVAIGMQSEIGPRSRVGPCCAIHHGVRIGARCDIGAGSYVGVKARIADGVTVPPGSVIPPRANVQSSADLRVNHAYPVYEPDNSRLQPAEAA